MNNIDNTPYKGIINNRFIFFEGFTINFIKEDDIRKFFEKYGEVQSICFKYDHHQKLIGSGMIEFKDVTTCQRLLNLSQINYCRRTISLDRVRNPDCWFCLNNTNPSGVKLDEIVYEDEHCYIVLCKGPINPRHVLLIPKIHLPGSSHLSAEINSHLETVKRKVADIYWEKFNELCFFSEMFLGNMTTNVAHLVIHIIPFSQDKFTEFSKALEDTSRDVIENLSKYTILRDEDSLLSYISQKDYYFLFEVSNKIGMRDDDFYAYRRLLIIPETKAKTFPRDYGRKVFCEIVGCWGKSDWKQCDTLVWTSDKYRKALREMFSYNDNNLCHYSVFQ